MLILTPRITKIFFSTPKLLYINCSCSLNFEKKTTRMFTRRYLTGLCEWLWHLLVYKTQEIKHSVPGVLDVLPISGNLGRLFQTNKTSCKHFHREICGSEFYWIHRFIPLYTALLSLERKLIKTTHQCFGYPSFSKLFFWKQKCFFFQISETSNFFLEIS